jgi:uncharacterized protein YbaP (TraB family)
MKRFCMGLLLLAGYYAGFAQKPASSLLWEIRGKGISQPSYLFGTFHLICRSDFPISETLKSRLAATKQFYGELAMDDPNKIAMELGMKMLMPDRTLQSLLPAGEYEIVEKKFLEITGMPLALFNQFKPFMALSIVTQNSISCADKIQPETEFVQLAKANQLPILGLETLEDEINAINTEPIDSQITALKKIVTNFDSTKAVMAQLVDVYKQRNVDSLYRFMKEAGTDSDFEKELLGKRNHKWIPVMEKAMAEKSSFFAVGAGHLGGPEGVINLLRQRGYEVLPVMY